MNDLLDRAFPVTPDDVAYGHIWVRDSLRRLHTVTCRQQDTCDQHRPDECGQITRSAPLAD